MNNNYTLINGIDEHFTLDVAENISSTEEIADNEKNNKVSVIYLPASVKTIECPLKWRFPALERVYIHHDNQYFSCEKNVIFSKDKKKIIRYFPKDLSETYSIDDSVDEISAGCFAEVDSLRRIDIGKAVRRIEHCALNIDMHFALEKIYIPPNVVELVGEIFDSGGDDSGVYYPIRVVGGVRGSAIETYCNERDITFVEFPEDKIEDFWAAAIDDLCELAGNQIENEQSFCVDDSENGYLMKFENGVLDFFVPDGTDKKDVVIKDTKLKISRGRRNKVKKIVIGDCITEMTEFAFDDYDNLEIVHIGADVRKIHHSAFSGRNESNSRGCRNLSDISVHEDNKWYRAKEGILYTHDMQRLVKYCPGKPELYYELDRHVRFIEDHSFEWAKHLQCLKVGDNCISVGYAAFLNVCALRHAYFAPSVSEWADDCPFVREIGFELPYRIDGLVVGGAQDSFVQGLCENTGTPFCVIEDAELDMFLAIPLPAEEGDKYIAEAFVLAPTSELDDCGEVCTGELLF